MKCRKVQQFLPDYIGDELSVQKRQQVDQHLTECQDCNEALEQFQKVWDGLTQQPSPQKDEQFWEKFTRGVMQKIRRKRPVPAESKKPFNLTVWRVLLPATAAVALAIIIVGLIVFSGDYQGPAGKGMWIAQEEQEALVEAAPDLSFGPLAMEIEDPLKQEITLQEASHVAEALNISLQPANGATVTDVLTQLYNGKDLDEQLEYLTEEELEEFYQLLSEKYPYS